MASSEHEQTSSTGKSILMTSSDQDIVTHSESVTVIYSAPTTSTISLSDYLVHSKPVTNIVTTPTALKISLPWARLLASDESLAILVQKEYAKKEALLEKEKRKMQRAENKQNRQESLQKKKEERVRKAEEKRQQEKAKTPCIRKTRLLTLLHIQLHCCCHVKWLNLWVPWLILLLMALQLHPPLLLSLV